MNPSNENQFDLQQRLDEAGQLCRPQDPGWATLLDRLPPQEPIAAVSAGEEPPQRPLRRRPARWKALAIAAGLLIAVVVGSSFWLGPHGPVHAGPTPPIEVQRRGIDVTVFSSSDNREPTLYMAGGANPWRQSPGMALVKDRRMILHLQKGDNLVKFTDVAASIDPTSVRLASDVDPMGFKVIEQNFEFDLASADALLKRSLERKITCVGKDGKGLYEGYLLSYDGGTIVLADKRPSDDPDAPRPKTQTISRGKLQAVRLGHKPSDLYTRPTLVWKLRTEKPGNHLTTLTYLCGDAVWRADYVALVRQSGAEGDTLDVNAWVTIDNRSGTTYEDAGLKLIAGDVNRVRDPWAPAPVRRERYYAAEFTLAAVVLERARAVPKKFEQKSFFEYKLYTLNQPSTIKDRQIKQLSLFKASDVKARRRYICRSEEGNNLHPEVQLLIKNEKENHLGRPLPKGTVRLTALDPDGDTQLLGSQEIDHTAKDEEVELEMGRAFDVVYGHRVVETQRPAERRMIRTYEFRIRNHKPYAVQVRAVAELSARQGIWTLDSLLSRALRGRSIVQESKTWKIIRSSDEFTKHDHKTVHFDVQVEPDSEKTITYTADYGW